MLLSLTAKITSMEGGRDGIRFGRVRWSDGVRHRFFHDRLTGVVRVIQSREHDGYFDITDEQARRVPSLRQALEAAQ